MFQEELTPGKFQKADLRVICTLKILIHTGIPVRLGTTIGKIKDQCQVEKRLFKQLKVHNFCVNLLNLAWRTLKMS
jgi:hypothetical protein